ncbi:hypothetical protein KKA00_08240 [bacterium]|nr:hypothetical protein [bacterium]MBU1652195.1 hypothetical protein [bacterium]MBU1880429.1 hypothetical protein [bacterium]
MVQKIRALGLISGGLDSTLAARLLIDQGIEVRGLYFSTGFCLSDPNKKEHGSEGPRGNLCHEALKVGEDLRFAVDVIDVSEEYLDIVTNPRWGYGKNANPCIDCRMMMLRKAKQLLEKYQARFVFTGEVLGQRPMTQHRATMRQLEKGSGLDGYLLRPLSALRLAITEVEQQALVDRTRLKGFTGRGRKPQMALAAELGLESYPQPAGGCCFLTDPVYGRKFHDFLKHLPEGQKVTQEDFILLKIGRHLRLSDRLKIVVGRNEAENNALEPFARNRWSLLPVDVVGPLAVLEGDVTEDDLKFAAQVVARYSDGKHLDAVKIAVTGENTERELLVAPLEEEETQQYIFK